jgi:hypothetical protein
MNRVKERSTENFLRAGAMLRLLKHVLGHTITEAQYVVTVKEMNMLEAARRKVDRVCSDTEDIMFKSRFKLDGFPEDPEHVFYGALGYEPRSDTDREVIRLIWEYLDHLEGPKDVFERK